MNAFSLSESPCAQRCELLTLPPHRRWATIMSDIAMRSVQANHPTYELHSLGWKAFQQLCVSVAGDVWGQVVQGFFDSHDGGRDGAFYGVWVPKGGEALEGSFAAQCKFSYKPNRTLNLLDLRDELAKAARLADRGLADNYILFTNMQLTGTSDETIRAAFEAIPGIKRCAIFGCERISQFIQESPRLRMLVPRVYGLGDLRAGSGCLDSSPRTLSGFLPGFAERGAFRFCRGVGRA